MSKSFAALLIPAVALAVAFAPAAAAVLGPHAAACAAGGGRAAMLVHVEGLKARSGMLRVQSYGGDPAHYFDKGSYLERVEVPVPSTGAIEVCMPVPRPGAYAVSVRHEPAGGSSQLAQGGGMSGNPNVSLMDVLFRRKPSPDQVKVEVRGIAVVPVVLNYVQGANVGPLPRAAQGSRG